MKLTVSKFWVFLLFLALTPFISQASDSTNNQEIETISTKTFQNLNGKGAEGKAKVTWNIHYKELDKVGNLVIRYQKKIEKGKPYQYTSPIEKDATKLEIDNLSEAEKYVWQIGALKNGERIAPNANIAELKDIVWSDAGKFETERSWGLFKFLVLFGSLGMFIYGMKMMSEGLQQTAGSGLRKILSGMTSNRYIGVLSGFLITALVQSSSATTVMTVSFVNAGLLTLVESAGVMMGANIGTTITGWLVSLFGFKISVSDYLLLFLAIGAPLLFLNRKRTKGWGTALIGFALLFMGLGLLKDAVPVLDADSWLIQFFTKFAEYGFAGRVMFVIMGTLVTIVVQSSSAAMALTLTLVLKGIIPIDVAAAIILGENIGTTITAELASIVGNVHAKRSARIHSLFNIIGVSWMVFLMPLFLSGIASVMVSKFGIDPYQSDEGATLALSAFHTIFNLTNVLFLIWFVPALVKLSTRTVSSKGEEDEVFKLEYISTGLMSTPELSVYEAKKEVVKFGLLTKKMLSKSKEMINETDSKKLNKLIKKITKYEEITDKLEIEIHDYLSKIATNELTDATTSDLRAMLSITNDLERIGDIFFEIAKLVDRKKDDKIWFDQTQRDGLLKLIAAIDKAFDTMVSNLEGAYMQANIEEAVKNEDIINAIRDEIRLNHLMSVDSGEYNAQAGLIYSNMFASFERVGDHIINVSEAAKGVNLK